jgi:PAS domain S-box-containing protein
MSEFCEEFWLGEEDAYRLIVDIAEEGIWILDRSDRMVFTNRKLQAMLGYAKDELLCRTIFDIVAAEDRDTLKKAMYRRHRGETETYPLRLAKKDGTPVWVIVAASPVMDKREEYMGVVSLASEITQLKQAEEALRESEENFRVLAEMSTAVIYVYQGENIVYVNEAAERISGYSRDELLKMKFWDIIHPDFKEQVKEYGLARQRGEPVPSQYEVKLITKNGKTRWTELTAGRIMYMGKPAGVATFFDISERKQADEKMRLTQFAVDNFTDSSIWMNKEGYITYANEVTCQTLGYTRDELLSMRLWDIDPYYSYERFMELWNEIRKRSAVKFESVHLRKDGSSFPVEVSVKYLRFEDKEYMITFDIDITERKQKEEALSDAKAQAELYLDLMSHDINNMNHIALGYLELADDLIKSGGKLGDHIELIEKPITSLNNSSKLIDKVMKLRKLKTKELRLDRVDVCKILARICDRYSHFSGRDVTINYTPPAECLVVANELIDEIFINLVENSIKHSSKDRPLVIDILQTKVYEAGSEYFRISIEDNGPGISDMVKDKLFARYSRGETKARGKGLGLYLIKILVEDFHGKIWVEDRVEGDYTKGARFVVMLPAVENHIP